MPLLRMVHWRKKFTPILITLVTEVADGNEDGALITLVTEVSVTKMEMLLSYS